MSEPPSIHGAAVLVGETAVLIRGPSGSGKSRLAFDLILAGRARQIPATLLIGDDRLHLSEDGVRLIARPAPALAGLIEIRGLGIRRCDHAMSGPVGLVVDLDAPDAARLPAADALHIRIGSVALSRVPVAPGFSGLPLVLAALTTAPFDADGAVGAQEVSNHIRPTLASL